MFVSRGPLSRKLDERFIAVKPSKAIKPPAVIELVEPVPVMMTREEAECAFYLGAVFAWVERASLAINSRAGIAPVTVRTIAAEVASVFGIPTSEIISKRRDKEACRARQVVMYVAKNQTPRSFPEIGRALGNRDHTTVLHGVRKITALLPTDEALAARVNEVVARLGVMQ